jgi:hypothetical protein
MTLTDAPQFSRSRRAQLDRDVDKGLGRKPYAVLLRQRCPPVSIFPHQGG